MVAFCGPFNMSRMDDLGRRVYILLRMLRLCDALTITCFYQNVCFSILLVMTNLLWVHLHFHRMKVLLCKMTFTYATYFKKTKFAILSTDKFGNLCLSFV